MEVGVGVSVGEGETLGLGVGEGVEVGVGVGEGLGDVEGVGEGVGVGNPSLGPSGPPLNKFVADITYAAKDASKKTHINETINSLLRNSISKKYNPNSCNNLYVKTQNITNFQPLIS